MAIKQKCIDEINAKLGREASETELKKIEGALRGAFKELHSKNPEATAKMPLPELYEKAIKLAQENIVRDAKEAKLRTQQSALAMARKPAFVVLPYADFIKLPGVVRPGMIPNAVVGKRIMDDVSMLQAWREYLMLTQADMAERMGITQAGYAQIEAAKRPRKATLQKAADALGITLEQLAY